jgi:hypothetical protein
VVTGDIGAAYMGLQEKRKQVFQVNPNSQPDLDAYTYLIERQLKPEARKDVRTLLHALEIKPTAMMIFQTDYHQKLCICASNLKWVVIYMKTNYQ